MEIRPVDQRQRIILLLLSFGTLFVGAILLASLYYRRVFDTFQWSLCLSGIGMGWIRRYLERRWGVGSPLQRLRGILQKGNAEREL